MLVAESVALASFSRSFQGAAHPGNSTLMPRPIFGVHHSAGTGESDPDFSEYHPARTVSPFLRSALILFGFQRNRGRE